MTIGIFDKAVVISGASGGVGSATARAFACNANLALIGRNGGRLEKVKEELEKKFQTTNVSTHVCDSKTLSELQRVHSEILQIHSSISGVVCNIGDGRRYPDDEGEFNSFDRLWDVNFRTAMNTVRTFEGQVRANSGFVTFVSSIAGHRVMGAPTGYSVAKSALVTFAKNLAVSWAPEVRVNVVAPGNIFFPGSTWDEKLKQNEQAVRNMIFEKVPLQRFATPDEIAEAIKFLSSEKASFITGVVLPVDGGQTL